MRTSTFSYILSGICLLGAVVGALAHDLVTLLWCTFFAIFNWYLGEWKRRLEDESIIGKPEDEE